MNAKHKAWIDDFGLRMAVLWLVLSLSVFQPVLAKPTQAQQLKRATGIWQLGYYHHINGAYDSAIHFYQRSIAIHPTAEAYTLLGWALSYKDQFEKAIDACKQAIKVDPDFGNPYNDIGAYLIALRREDEAVPWLEKATRARRYCCYAFPWANLGRIHLRNGRTDDARSAFNRALQYDSTNAVAQEGLSAIREGRLPNY